ncbi:trehalose-phosphatase [Rhodoblastus sp.]|uniref:trehalose-phosphatase n=1 Tax=Rhodoblastus sp. TaxID=1962975 RepID=UPI0035B19EB5
MQTQARARPDAIDAPSRIALFLDLDGTLIDIAPTPSVTAPPPGLSGLVAELTEGLDGAVAILSGRTLATIDRLLDPLRPLAAGAHGAEMREERGGDGRAVAPPLPERLVQAVARLSELDPGVAIEPKGSAIAVHYRLAAQRAPELLRRLEALLAESALPLEIRPGRMVFEITPKSVSKGEALKAFMQRPAFRGRRPIAIGDDATDLDAFVAAEQFGGQGLRVAGEFFAEADADFDGTAAVRRWLLGLAVRIAAEKDGEASCSSIPPWTSP